MITIIQRELLDNFKSFRFIMLFTISIVLFSLNGILFAQRIKIQLDSYNENKVNPKYRSTYYALLFKKPSLLMFMSEGGDRYRMEKYNLSPTGQIHQDFRSSSNFNYKMPETPELDWAFIIKVIFSLHVLLLGYDAISGEKEKGTLRLILSHPFGRIRLIVAKYCSMIITVITPLLLGMLISMIIVGISIPQVLTYSTFTSFLMMVVIAFIYLSLFVFLSLLLSSLIHQSSVVLLVLLSIWLMFLVIPEMSFTVLKKFSNVPREYQIKRQIDSKDSYSYILDVRKGFQKRIDAGEFHTKEEVIKEGTRMTDEIVNDITKMYEQYENSMKRQRENARYMSRSSPIGLFQYASENVAGTGLKQLGHFLSNIKAFSPVYADYVIEKVGKLVDAPQFTKNWSLAFNGERIRFDTPHPEQYQDDMSDFPVFSPSEPSIVQRVHDALIDLSGLLLWNIGLAMGALLAFNRADVR